MVLKDSETGEDIINPHITIYYPGEIRNWVTLNTHTFGKTGESKLITHIEALKISEKAPMFKVYSTIRSKAEDKFDTFSDYPEINIKMGYLLEGVMKELFSKSYNILREMMIKMNPHLSHLYEKARYAKG